MEAAASSDLQQQPNDSPSRGQRHRRPRRDRGGSASSSLTMRPASVVPESAIPTSRAETTGESSRGRERGRGRGRPDQSRTVNGRQFGGQLTQTDTSSTSQAPTSTQLQPNAPVFVPGQQQGQQPASNQPKPQRQPQRRPSKSQAPDIATRTHEDIDHGHYECAICTSEVRRNSKVWSCHTCWTVFHLVCIKKWCAKEASAAAQPTAQSDDPAPKQWRCPGCNLPKDDFPNLYSCWCGKEIDPKPLAGLPPHSCGNTCSKERTRKCPHPCQLTCHAGPCPPCSHIGPTLVCFCGKHEVTKRCSETDYTSGWSCGEICEEVMPCGKHTCSRPCHEGLCGACEVRVSARCYCGQVEKDLICDDRGEEVESSRKHLHEGEESILETWTGLFECGNICDRPFDCGEHTCEKRCHTQSTEPEHCPRTPDVVTHCPCGKTPLGELSDTVRETCTDPIPQCKQPCGRTLSCGHEDEHICHSGPCAPCTKIIEIKCRCGRTTSNAACHQARAEPPLCERICKANLSCGRHNCDEKCCSGERKAIERQSSRKKARPLNSLSRPLEDGFEAEHICTFMCGRLLKCGTHFCQELCHRGPCGTCREAIFDEIGCHCGRTILQPPLPCGTKAPPCRYPCTRPKTCGHPQVAHNCHQDDEACPKCPYLMDKRCMCGKKALKNQQCWLQDVRCGEVCRKQLKCGSHFCRKPCHRPGECEDADGQACQQPCGKMKKTCGHPDVENTCHAPFACKEDKPCQSKIYITCTCQALKQEMKCGASKTSDGNTAKQLPCNEECARLERNRKLALALNIDQSAHVDGGDHIPYSTETLNLFTENVKWAQEQEREFRVFASSEEERRLRFKPMKAQQRAFVHALAEDFGFDSESMDPEPHRHVMIWKTPRFVSAPSKTLADSLRIRLGQRATNVSANVSDSESNVPKSRSVFPSNEPYNSFVIRSPRFGLTVDEVRTEINLLLRPSNMMTFDISFLPSEEVVLKANSPLQTGSNLQVALQTLKPQLIAALSSKGFGTAELCSVDGSLNILRRECDSPAEGGWSKVLTKKAAPKVLVSSTESPYSNAYAALGSNKVTFTKKKPVKPKQKPESVVDDWEAAELAEEEKEKGLSGASGDEGGVVSGMSDGDVGSPNQSNKSSLDQ